MLVGFPTVHGSSSLPFTEPNQSWQFIDFQPLAVPPVGELPASMANHYAKRAKACKGTRKAKCASGSWHDLRSNANRLRPSEPYRCQQPMNIVVLVLA